MKGYLHARGSSPILAFTTFAIEKAPPNIWYGRMAERIIRIERSIDWSLEQLPNTSMTARFHLGTSGKRHFDDSHIIWFQTLSATFSGALAWFLAPFIKHAFFLPSYNWIHLNRRFTVHNIKHLHSTPVVPMHCQLSSKGGGFIFFMPQVAMNVAWPKKQNFSILENDHLTSNLSHF